MVGNRTISAAPLGVTLIAGFYVFGAVILLITMWTNPDATSRTIAERHGMPAGIGVAILPMVAALALGIACGLLTLSRWGFLLTLAYLSYFGSFSLAASLGLAGTPGAETTQIYFGNFLWSGLVILYLISVRRRFLR